METKVLERPLIGIPVYKDHECFLAMIDSLRSSTNWYERIIIIESDGDELFWAQFKVIPNIEIIHAKKEGPLKAYNLLFEIAKKENKDLLITQTDVIFPRLYKRDWLQIMNEYANHPKIGIVIPRNGGGISGPDYIDGYPWAGGWCSYISKKCWEVFTGYDSNYPMGYGVDIKMTYQISKKYAFAEIDYWVDHHMMNSREHDNNPNAEQARKEAGKMFRKEFKLGEFSDDRKKDM